MSNLSARDLAVLWHPCAQMRDYVDFTPLHVIGAQGSRIHLADGSTVIDAISSWWCKSLGHRHPRLLAALREQLDNFEHVLLANTTNAPVVRLCERLLLAANGDEQVGPPFTKVFFADNGSTAVEVALKMAAQAQQQRGHPHCGHQQRTRFACLENGYHGETVGALSVSDCGLYRQHYGALLSEPIVLRGLPYRDGPHDPRWQDAAAEWPGLEQQLDAQADVLAAIVIEPLLQGAGGMRLYSPDLLRRLRTWCDAHDTLLIADEIAAGWGRLGTMLASHHAGVRPDVVVLSKGLTGGVLPFAAVLATEAMYQIFFADYRDGRAFLHSNTYAGNALGVAVAHAVLDEYEHAAVLARVAQVGPRLRTGLVELARTRPWLSGVRGCGMMAAVDLRARDGSMLDPASRTGYACYRAAVNRGALLRNLGDTLYLFPPLNISAGDIDELLSILAASVDEILA